MVRQKFKCLVSVHPFLTPCQRPPSFLLRQRLGFQIPTVPHGKFNHTDIPCQDHPKHVWLGPLHVLPSVQPWASCRVPEHHQKEEQKKKDGEEKTEKRQMKPLILNMKPAWWAEKSSWTGEVHWSGSFSKCDGMALSSISWSCTLMDWLILGDNYARKVLASLQFSLIHWNIFPNKHALDQTTEIHLLKSFIKHYNL